MIICKIFSFFLYAIVKNFLWNNLFLKTIHLFTTDDGLLHDVMPSLIVIEAIVLLDRGTWKTLLFSLTSNDESC